LYEPALIVSPVLKIRLWYLYVIVVKLPEVHFCARGPLGETLLDPATLSGLLEIALLTLLNPSALSASKWL
jgi:hypothetical protein